ncbi:MAG TPA: helix-turn-helix domain-containing protein, partial [Candidatus Limnocylindria bacterium]|nr:helix-turn-helix domain-containing protein [Candidatus Limnocylindria bacterium]
MTEELHKLGEVLRAARELRGVDLARVERDTKIRSRYLSALERGEYRELPGPVYTKGFLRNYGLYLGLDPEYLTDLYRLETNGSSGERTAPAPPRPMAIRRPRALVVTPGAIAAALLTAVVIAIVGYVAYELVTFARVPVLTVSQPTGDVASYHETSYTIVGVAPPNSTITVDGLRENPVVTADAQGHFSVVVQLVPGSNVITLVANDPLTKRDSDKVTRTIYVDFGGASPTPGIGGLVLAVPREG